jgi:hypothetical protein
MIDINLNDVVAKGRQPWRTCHVHEKNTTCSTQARCSPEAAWNLKQDANTAYSVRFDVFRAATRAALSWQRQ